MLGLFAPCYGCINGAFVHAAVANSNLPQHSANKPAASIPGSMHIRFLFLALCVAVATPASAQVVADLVPAQATHCALTEPPAKAGIAGTPGGFVMVFPRNDALTDTFTGCKLLWVLDGDKAMRFATLYFKNGKLSIAIAHDVRDSAGSIAGACALPEGKSLLPKNGRQIADEACKGFTEDDFYALRLPTWPRSCLTETRAAVCAADPRLE